MLNAHNHATDNGVVEAEVSFQLIDRFLRSFNVQQNVVSFVQFVDRVSQLTAAPVFQTVNLTSSVSDGSTVTLDHARNLFALVRMDHKNDFVMTHRIAPYGLFSLLSGSTAARGGKERVKGRLKN
ncbi:hypothetical protein D3C76_1502620 [compost metagenome]